MGLVKSLKHEKVTQLPLFSPLKLAPDVAVREALEQMRKRKLGSVVVVDGDDRVLGLFSERRLVKLIAKRQHFLDDPIEKHMATESIRANHQDSIADVMETMRGRGVRFLVVVDDDDKVLGQTGQKSVIRYIAEHFPRSITVQMLGSKLFMDQREGA
jgi:CBS domain-containing protein